MAKALQEIYSCFMEKIDVSTITTPRLEITEEALRQIQLAYANDPYTQGKNFRVHISGKGCNGFTYECFFDHKRDSDFNIQLGSEYAPIVILMAPFTSYYLQEGVIDYVRDEQTDEEGFSIKNKNQKMFHGKFWRENQDLTPPLN